MAKLRMQDSSKQASVGPWSCMEGGWGGMGGSWDFLPHYWHTYFFKKIVFIYFYF